MNLGWSFWEFVDAINTWAHLAVCGDELFVRELNALAVYRWQMPKKGG
jgi:hypothetical protein